MFKYIKIVLARFDRGELTEKQLSHTLNLLEILAPLHPKD